MNSCSQKIELKKKKSPGNWRTQQKECDIYVCVRRATSFCRSDDICTLQVFRAAEREQRMQRPGHGTFNPAAGPTRLGPRTAPARPVTWRAPRAERVKSHGREHPAGPCSLCSFSRLGRGTFCCSSRDPRGEASRTSWCPSPGPRTGSRAKPRLSTDNEIVAAAGGE